LSMSGTEKNWTRFQTGPPFFFTSGKSLSNICRVRMFKHMCKWIQEPSMLRFLNWLFYSGQRVGLSNYTVPKEMYDFMKCRKHSSYGMKLFIP
jgi:hypothetical protein